MSTRATITVADDENRFDIYQHHDGYPEGPHGLVRHIALAQRLAWDLPRFEAADFAAAVIAVLKDRGGSTYLTQNADTHADRDYHYRIEPLREGVSTQVQLTIRQPSWRDVEPERELFQGSIIEAVRKFNAVGKIAEQPREYRILADAEGALWRAMEEISALCGDRPDEDAKQVNEDIEAATRSLMRLRQHLEQADPWRTLKLIDTSLQRLRTSDQPIAASALPTVDAKLAVEAHQRFQRDDV